MQLFVEVGSCFLENPGRVDQCGPDTEVRRDVPQQVGEVVGGVLEGLCDLAHLAERQRVTGLEQHPAGLRELHRALDVEQTQADAVGEPERARIEAGRAGEGESRETAVRSRRSSASCCQVALGPSR